MGARPVLLAACALTALASFASATGDGIGMLLPGEKVSSTLAASGERKTVGFAGVEGSSLQIDAAAVKGGAVKPRISVLAPDGSTVDVGDTNPKATGRARCKIAKLASTGVWRIGVETPAGDGGAFTLSTTVKTPLAFKWNGTLDASGAPTDETVAAAPGGTMTVVVTSKGRPLFDPTVDLLSPAGGVVAHAAGVKGRALVVAAPLADLGRYVVRVTGGPGAFKASAAVKPAKKRAPTYHDVEARPEVRGFSPATTPNDVVATITVDGFAFSTQQTISVAAGTASKSAQIARIDAGGASADLDLDDVPPGTYPVYVTTAEGNSTLAPQPIVVTNRVPGVAQIYPVETSNKYPSVIDVQGVGFDATASAFLRRSSDGVAVPFAIGSRTGHTDLKATATPVPYFTGPCDLEIRDPDGSNAVVPGGVDLLGFRGAPAVLRSYSGPSAYWNFFARDAAYDETDGRVLLSVQEGWSGSNIDCAFVLFDPATLTVLDTLVVTNSSITQPITPRVAWNPRDGTFALTCDSLAASGGSYVRIVSAQNIHTTLAERQFASGATYQMHAAANPDSGGYVLFWDDHSVASAGARLLTQVVAADGSMDTATQTTIAQNANGNIWGPIARYQGGGRFVVAWVGATQDDLYYAVRNTVVDAAGRQTADAGPYVAGTSTHWYQIFQPEMARNPNDGSMLLSYSYFDVSDTNTYRPACQLLDAVSAIPGPASTLDASGFLPQGLMDSLIWDPNRGQFIVTLTNAAHRVAVRRVNPDASIRPTSIEESYEGDWGILYTASKPGTLGLARAFDGVDDDSTNTSTSLMQIIAGPFR